MPTEQKDLSASLSTERVLEEVPFSFEEHISLLDLIVVLVRRKKAIIWTTLVASVSAVVISLLIPNSYTATTTIMPPQQPQSLASALATQLGGTGMLGAVAGKDLGLKNPNDIYVGMLSSRVVVDALIRRFDLMAVYRANKMSSARKMLEAASEIQAGKQGLITVSVEDHDPKRAAAVANAYIDELRNLTSSMATTESGQRRLFFEQQLRKAKDDLANAEVALKETQQTTGIIQLDGQASAIIEAVANVRAQIAAKEVQLKVVQSFATEQNPDLMVVRNELSGLKVQLAKLEKQQNAGGGDIQVPTTKVPEAGLEYVRRLRDVKYCETLFDLIAKQFEAAKLDEARQGALIQVVDPAVEPDTKTSPKRALIVIGSFFVALLGSILWAFVAEGIARARRDPVQFAKMQALADLLHLSRQSRTTA